MQPFRFKIEGKMPKTHTYYHREGLADNELVKIDRSNFIPTSLKFP